MTASVRASALGLLLVALTQTAGAPAGAESPPPPGAQEVDVLAVMQDQRTLLPTVVLESKRDRRHLTMVIGPAEATSIAVPLQGVVPPRPLTHDLFLTLFGRLEATLTRVVINDLRDGIYFATVHLLARGTPLALDARPSDAIALAVRAKVPVFVEDRVFAKSGPPPAAPRKAPSI
jgi:bifunctional DNase/RNase